MKPKFIPNEDLDDQPEYHGYYGLMETYDEFIKTPFFKDKLECEKFTRELHEANNRDNYTYELIRYKLGHWSDHYRKLSETPDKNLSHTPS